MIFSCFRGFAFVRALVCSTACVAILNAPTSAANPIDVYAAGSLREAMSALEAAFQAELKQANASQSGATFSAKFLFGPSGKLRERIEAGERPVLFASAAPEHTERLQRAGLLQSSNLFAGNALCVMARPGFALTGRSVTDALLSDDVIVGTSTPGADPSGDYTWQMFRKIDAVTPGAFAKLDAKARKLTGAEVNPAETRAAYARILLDKQADVFVTYCTNAKSAQKAEPAITFVVVPDAINVVANYSIGIAANAPELAREFLRFVLSERSRPVLAALGFSAPQPQCSVIPPIVKAAHDVWVGPRASVAASVASDGAVSIESAKRYRISLLPAAALTLTLARAAASANAVRKDTTQSGGVVEYIANTSGHIEVFTDRRAYFDLIRKRDGRALDSIRSERWLGCAGVGKNLGFKVDAGERYRIEFLEVDGGAIDALLMPLDVR
jgi:molybdate transport system substrate-binding protein